MKKRHVNSVFTIYAIILFSTIFIAPPFAQSKNTGVDVPVNQTGLLKLSGIIKGYQGNPISNADVILVELGKTAPSDETGRFHFHSIPPGKYHIEVYAEGYMNYKSDLLDLTKVSMSFDVTLFKALAEDIVVTATRTPKIYAEVPVKTEVITARDIEIRQATQLAEAMTFTTGIRVENNCQNCNFTQVRINGMEGKYSQILLDNSPVFSSMIGVYGLEQIPTEMLNRIEVVKGGGSALYGGNAVAGVINVLTREPSENSTSLRFHQEAVSGEPLSNMGFRTGLVSPSGATKGFLFANYRRRDPVDLNDDDFSELGRLRSTNFGFNLYQSAERIRGKLKLGFFRITEERRGGNKFELPPHEADIAEAIDSRLTGLSLEWNQYIDSSSYYSLGASYVDASRDTYYGAEQDLNAYGSTENPVLFLNGQFNRQFRNHLLSTGMQFKGEGLTDRALAYGRLINDEYREFGFFLQDDMKLNRVFSLLAGLRVSKHSLVDRLIFTPRFSVLANLARDISWRTTFSSGYRAPQVFDEDLHITQVGGEGMIIQNSPDLEEETSAGISTGFDFGRQIGNNLIQLSVEGFYTRLYDAFVLDEIELDPRENALVFERINGSGAKVYGISLDIGLRMGRFIRLDSGWTLQRSRLNDPEPDFGSKEFFRTPDSYGFLQLGYENPDIIDIDLSLDYTGRMNIPHFAGYIAEDRLDIGKRFCVINTKISRKLKPAENYSIHLFVGIFNLLDSFQADLDKGVARDAGYVYGPSKPRSLYAGFEFSF